MCLLHNIQLFLLRWSSYQWTKVEQLCCDTFGSVLFAKHSTNAILSEHGKETSRPESADKWMGLYISNVCL